MQEEIDNLNTSISIKEIDFSQKHSQEMPGPVGIIVNSSKLLSMGSWTPTQVRANGRDSTMLY